MQRFLENTFGRFLLFIYKNTKKRCDKRFMPKNRSNVGETVTINRCISTLISFSAFKKDCPSSTSSVCQAGDTHKFSLWVGLTTAPTIYPNIYIYQEYQAYQSIFQISSTNKRSKFLPLRAVPYGMENHFYHIRLHPLNVIFFITHVRNSVMGATPMGLCNLKKM